jgi:CheY-like chemotaxis protein
MPARILLAMDHQTEVQLVGDCLEQVGHEVTNVNSYHNAMEALRETDFDMIISDVHLQNSGSVFDFLRWVKGDPHMRSTLFVCFSHAPAEIGKYLADGRTAARSLGADRFLSMEHFDGRLLLSEVDWLLPEEQVGNCYSGSDAKISSNGNVLL